jgi:hypothetical protein
VGGTLVNHKLGDKEFVEQDFNDTIPPKAMNLNIKHQDGKPSNNDPIVVSFWEPLAETTMCSTWGMDNTKDQSLTGVTLRIVDGGLAANDKLVVSNVGTACGGTGFHFGEIALGSQSYVTAGSADFTASKIQWNHNGTLTFTLGGTPSALVNAVADLGITATYKPDSAMTDVTGNPATGSISDTAGGSSSHF